MRGKGKILNERGHREWDACGVKAEERAFRREEDL